MKPSFTIVKFLFIGLLVLSFTAYGQITQTTSDQSNKSNNTNATPLPADQNARAGQQVPLIYLDTLTIGVDVLFNVHEPKKRIDQRINFVFELYVQDDAVTLHGWRFKRSSQGVNQLRKFTPDSSEVFLKPVGKSSVAIGPDTYINNQVFYAKDMKTMIRDIEKVRDRNPQLYFIPTKDLVTKRIRYNVLVGVRLAASGSSGAKIQNLTGATYQTNPSPPHQSSDN